MSAGRVARGPWRTSWPVVAGGGGTSWSRALLAVEVTWYAAVLAARVLGPEGGSAGRRPEFFVMAALGAVCAGAALLRWRRPRWTAGIAAGVFVVGLLVVVLRPPGPLAPLRLLMSLALVPVLVVATVRSARPAPTLAVVALAGAAGLADAAFYGNTFSVNLSRSLLELYLPDRGVVLLSAAVALLAPVAVGLVLRSADGARAAALLHRRRAEERRAAAGDLHDLVSTHVTGMILTAQAAATTPELAPGTRDALRTIEGAGQRALDAMQRMVTALRSPDDAPTGATPATAGAPRTLADVVRGAGGAQGGVAVHATGDGASGLVVDDAVARVIEHVVAEAVTNARRHAPPGTAIEVEYGSVDPHEVLVQVSNQRGPALVRGAGYGLVGLAERVAAAGGRFEAGPVGDDGWRARAVLPRAAAPRSPTASGPFG